MLQDACDSFLAGAASNKQVQTKVIDNKLKIIDDVPSSAVEMAVKEKVRLVVRKLESDLRKLESDRLVCSSWRRCSGRSGSWRR